MVVKGPRDAAAYLFRAALALRCDDGSGGTAAAAAGLVHDRCDINTGRLPIVTLGPGSCTQVLCEFPPLWCD
jgi:hypothetical protein